MWALVCHGTIWRSEDKLWKLDLSSFYHLGLVASAFIAESPPAAPLPAHTPTPPHTTLFTTLKFL